MGSSWGVRFGSARPLGTHQRSCIDAEAFLSLAALALVASPALAGDKSKYNSKVSVGDKAPTFAGIPATTPKGEEVSLSLGDIKEDVVVLVFLANHCPAVVGYEDRIQQLVDDFKGKSVKVVGVAVSGERHAQARTTSTRSRTA